MTGKKRASLIWAIAVTAASVAAVVIAGLLYFAELRTADPAGVTPAASAMIEQASPAPRPPEMLVPEIIPFIPDRQRLAIRTAYMSSPDHKAIAISVVQASFITDQRDEETAKAAALEACSRATDPIVQGQRCAVSAVGNTVVYGRGRPPLPPEPWVAHDPAVETPFAVESVPLAIDAVRANLRKAFPDARNPKALAISPQGLAGFYFRQSSEGEAVRRALELCGSRAGVACVIVAVDDAFVVPIPATMKAVGLFRAAGNPAIAPEARDDVARRLGSATSSWSAVAVGASGRCGLALRAASERDAIDGALTDCSRLDRACRVVAIGPFTVEPR